MQALAASYEFLVRRRPTPILLGSLVDEALTVFRSRVDIDGGPAVWVKPDASMSLVLALHELATNAAKYGALFLREGRVVVRCTVESDRLCLIWTELNGPRPVARSNRGFGSRLTQRAIELIPGGSVTMDFQASGLVCTLTIRCGSEGPAFTEQPEKIALQPQPDPAHDRPAPFAMPVGGTRKRRSF